MMVRMRLAALIALLICVPTHTARANPQAYGKACDNLTPTVRIAGCTHLIGRMPKGFAHVPYWQRGQGYAMLKRYDEAIADYNKGIAIKATSLLYSNRGDANKALRNYTAANADYDRAIQLDPKNIEPLNNKALLLMLESQFDRALTFYDRALALNPKHPVVLNGRGTAWQSKGDYDRALRDFDAAIQSDPRNVAAYLNIGTLYQSKGETDRSIGYFDQVLRLDPANELAYSNRAGLYQRKGDYDRAFADIKRAIEINPSNANVVAMRSSIHLFNGDYERAVADGSAALRIDPNYLGAYHNRGSAYLKLGAFGQARSDFEKIIEAEPDNGSAYAGLAMIFSAEGKIDQSLASFDKAIALDPLHAGQFSMRGLTREKKGDFEGAKDDYRKAISLNRIHLIRNRGFVTVTEDSKDEQDQARARLLVLGDASGGETPPLAPPAPIQKTEPQTPPRDLGRRIALILGNGAYANANKLPNPPNDARAVGGALKDMGFEVTEGVDLGKQALQEKIAVFLREAPTAKLLVLFYAGHGMQIDGKNYLVPVDARFDDTSSFTAGMLDMDTILSALDGKLTTNIVILDACRDNPLAQEAQAAQVASRGIRARSGLAAPSSVGAGETAGAGTLIAFATAPGQVALDGDGANSPFSSALTRHIATPGLEVQQMLTRVRAEVVASTKNKQVPWANSALVGEVFLRP